MEFRELQLVSVEVCACCREAAPFRLRITTSTPRWLWEVSNVDCDGSGGGGGGGNRWGEGKDGSGCAASHRAAAVDGTSGTRNGLAAKLNAYLWRWILNLLGLGGRGGCAGRLARGKGRVPRLRVVSLIWAGSVESMRYGDILPPGLEELELSQDFNESVQEVRWPSTLKNITFGRNFAQDVAGLAWPPCLEVLRFGFHFNRSLDGVGLPGCLRVLVFDWHFNQPLDEVILPQRLEEITFGYMFCQSLDKVVFPDGLAKVSFGESFHVNIDAVKWPRGLKSLSFGRCFNHGVHATALPKGLLELTFGTNFAQPLEQVAWPESLECIDLGGCPSAIERVVWPAALKRLTLGAKFQGRLGDLPSGLKHIMLGTDFGTQAGLVTEISWPVGLETIVFHGVVHDPIADVVWPERLKNLKFISTFDHPLDDFVRPPALERLEICHYIHPHLGPVGWREILPMLTISFGRRWEEKQKWPPGVEDEFGWKGYRKRLLS